MIPMKHVKPSAAQQAFRDDMIAAMRRHQHLAPDEMLAVASYFVGQLVAMQDQRKVKVYADVRAGSHPQTLPGPMRSLAPVTALST